MSEKITVQALANYEWDKRPMTLGRFVDICAAIGVSALDVLGLALQRAGRCLYVIEIQVDLHALTASTDETLTCARGWARNLLAREPDGTGVGRLAPEVVNQWAVMVEKPRHVFVGDLLAFTPRAAPDHLLSAGGIGQ